MKPMMAYIQTVLLLSQILELLLNTYTVQHNPPSNHYIDGLVVYTPEKNSGYMMVLNLESTAGGGCGQNNFYTPNEVSVFAIERYIGVYYHGLLFEQPMNEYAVGRHYLPNISFVRLQQVFASPGFFCVSLPPPITSFISLSLNARPSALPTQGITYLSISSSNTNVLVVNTQNKHILEFSSINWHIPQVVAVTLIKAMGTAELILTLDGMDSPSSVLFSNAFVGDTCSPGWLGLYCNISKSFLFSLILLSSSLTSTYLCDY